MIVLNVYDIIPQSTAKVETDKRLDHFNDKSTGAHIRSAFLGKSTEFFGLAQRRWLLRVEKCLANIQY